MLYKVNYERQKPNIFKKPEIKRRKEETEKWIWLGMFVIHEHLKLNMMIPRITKTLLYTILLTLLVSANIGCISQVASQESVGTPPEEEWNKKISVFNNERAQSLYQTSDGGYIIAGSGFWLMKVDQDGNEQWNRTLWRDYNRRIGNIQQTKDGGYIVAGNREWLSEIWLVKIDTKGAEQWNLTFGGKFFDDRNVERFIHLTPDKGYILFGRITSCDDCPRKAWITKIDEKGNELWNRTFGDKNANEDYSFFLTSDSGFVLAGTSNSFGPNNSDFWLVKADSNGKDEWIKTFEGIRKALDIIVQQTSDNGYIITGIPVNDTNYTNKRRPWLMKTDSNGTQQWIKMFGEGYYSLKFFKQTRDDGYLLAYFDRLIKTDSHGKILWKKSLGGIWLRSIEQTADNGYILAGARAYSSDSYGGHRVIKIDSNGNQQWMQTYGEMSASDEKSAIQTIDGGYMLWGEQNNNFIMIKLGKETTPSALFTYYPQYPGINQTVTFDASLSYDPAGDITNYQWNFGDGNTTNTTQARINHSYSLDSDITVILTVKNNIGLFNSMRKKITIEKLISPEVTWKKNLTGYDSGSVYSFLQASDGGYVITGNIRTYASSDNLLIKTDPEGNEQWNQSFGGEIKTVDSVAKTSDGGYIISYETWSNSGEETNIWLAKKDSNGNEQWNRRIGGEDSVTGYSAAQTSDGGYFLFGLFKGNGGLECCPNDEFRLIKTDPGGNEQWIKKFGVGNEGIGGFSAYQTQDDGYIIAGRMVVDVPGNPETWLVKTDSMGNEQWKKKVFRNSIFAHYDLKYIRETSDGGYIITGYKFGIGIDSNALLVKTDAKGNQQWMKTFSGTGDYSGEYVEELTDGGFILSGIIRYSSDNYEQSEIFDLWIVKTDAYGNMQWQNRLEGIIVHSIQLTSDGGYFVAGQMENNEIHLIKIGGGQIKTIEDSRLSEKIPESTSSIPGFEAMIAICSLLAIVYHKRNK